LGYSKDFVAKEKAFQRSDCSMEEIRAHKDLADLIRGSRAPEPHMRERERERERERFHFTAAPEGKEPNILRKHHFLPPSKSIKGPYPFIQEKPS